MSVRHLHVRISFVTVFVVVPPTYTVSVSVIVVVLVTQVVDVWHTAPHSGAFSFISLHSPKGHQLLAGSYHLYTQVHE